MKRAIISVFNKDNLDLLVPYLVNNNYEIYSTGGTHKYIKNIITDETILHDVGEYTKYPEICNGRVKTLHPKIFGGLLGLPNNPLHCNDLKSIDAQFFNLVVVNLYPFEETIKNTNVEADIIENIDIGGHTLIRAAVKNYKNVIVLTDPSQYDKFMNMEHNNYYFAKKGIQHVMNYDIAINNWFNEENIGISYEKQSELKYGLNPYMKPCNVYVKHGKKQPYEILNGKPGYINLLDANNAIHIALEAYNQLHIPCCTSFKHTSPAGVVLSDEDDIFSLTRNVDPKSSFGDFIGYSGKVNERMARIIKKQVSDGIIAVDYDEDALEILREKKKGNYIILRQSELISNIEYRDVNGVTLSQPSNDENLIVTKYESTINNNINQDIALGFITLKYTQSNSVCFVYKGTVIGIGAGQQNRVDCVRIAGNKAYNWLLKNGIKNPEGLVLVSDAFFPFPDNIDVANEYGVKYVAHPGGSIRDNEIEDACKKYGIELYCTGKRVFTH